MQRLSPSSPEVKKSRESEPEQEPEPKTAAPKPSATAAGSAQKTKRRNLERNLGLVWQLPHGFRRTREKASEIQVARETDEEREGEEESE